MSRDFTQLLEKKWDEQKFLCIGLDTDFEKIPEHLRSHGVREAMVAFNRAIVQATKDLVCAYKPNMAFYEAHGDLGMAALRDTIQYILEVAPDVGVILDAKRADIGNTNAGYAASAFDHLRADAITVHPYLGSEALKPFLDRCEKGIIVLCRTSNPGAAEVQDLSVDGRPLYMHIAKQVRDLWNYNGNCALVVGATYPEEMKKIREAVGDIPFLVPGIGAQGGDIEKTVQCGKDSRGKGIIISASRSVIYASAGQDYAEAARAEAEKLHGAIQKAL